MAHKIDREAIIAWLGPLVNEAASSNRTLREIATVIDKSFPKASSELRAHSGHISSLINKMELVEAVQLLVKEDVFLQEGQDHHLAKETAQLLDDTIQRVEKLEASAAFNREWR